MPRPGPTGACRVRSARQSKRPPDDEAAGRARLLQGWELVRSAGQPPRIRKLFKFDDFLGSMAFVDKMAALAEGEGHHPDFCVHYAEVDVTLWTHAVGGLSDNDFILAAKIDAILL